MSLEAFLDLMVQVRSERPNKTFSDFFLFYAIKLQEILGHLAFNIHQVADRFFQQNGKSAARCDFYVLLRLCSFVHVWKREKKGFSWFTALFHVFKWRFTSQTGEPIKCAPVLTLLASPQATTTVKSYLCINAPDFTAFSILSASFSSCVILNIGLWLVMGFLYSAVLRLPLKYRVWLLWNVSAGHSCTLHYAAI